LDVTSFLSWAAAPRFRHGGSLSQLHVTGPDQERHTGLLLLADTDSLRTVITRSRSHCTLI